MGILVIFVCFIVIVILVSKSSKKKIEKPSTESFKMNWQDYDSKPEQTQYSANQTSRWQSSTAAGQNGAPQGALISWLKDREATDVVVFDTETNGLEDWNSVLSISAIRYKWVDNGYLQEKSRFNRFYFPKEEYNQEAISVNGLSKEVLVKNREGCSYPDYYLDDTGFKEFCDGVKMFIAHNAEFDKKFFPWLSKKRVFDTMKTNSSFVRAGKLNSGAWKWPTLAETARYYGVSFSEDSLHDSMYDTEITGKVFIAMLKKADLKITITND